MRLRQQFLTLVALLLLFVLGGSFFSIFHDLKAEFLRGFEADLETSVASFRAQEEQRFHTLGVIAGFLEASPSFRTVLRRSDYQTTQEYLKDVNGDTEVTLIVVTDSQGILLNRTDKEGEQGTDLSNFAPLQIAVEGEPVSDYWLEDGILYQVVTIPLVDSQDFVDGTLTLGFELDQAFVDELRKEMGAEVALKLSDWELKTSAELIGNDTEFLKKEIEVGGDGVSTAQIIIGKSLTPMQKFVTKSQGKLLQLGAVALILALLVSIPLLGKMTNPVLLLEAAQAEMETIFTANLDGLLATDERGLITTCNPAATIALGYPAEELVGANLAERLPEGIHERLQSATSGGTQVATFSRQGHDFRLYRNYIRLHESDLLGSIYLFHDVTEEQEREHLFRSFLDQLTDPETAPELGLQNLQLWAELNQLSSEPELSATSVPDHDELEVLAAPKWLELCLQNLKAFSSKWNEGGLESTIEPSGGSVRFTFTASKWNGRSEDLSVDPLRSKLGVDALGLFITCELLGRQNSHLDFDADGKCLSFNLPKAVEIAD